MGYSIFVCMGYRIKGLNMNIPIVVIIECHSM